jgi:hypothetical protein
MFALFMIGGIICAGGFRIRSCFVLPEVSAHREFGCAETMGESDLLAGSDEEAEVPVRRVCAQLHRKSVLFEECSQLAMRV